MSKTILINHFGNGMANDIYGDAVGEFSISKHFDILTSPNRLTPFRGMAADTANTGIGNIVVGADNVFYGLGTYTNGSGTTALWKRSGGNWIRNTNSASNTISYSCWCVYHDNSGLQLLFASTTANKIDIFDPTDGTSISSHSLTYSNLCQGFVHPINDILYFGNDNNITQNNNGSWTNNILVLPTYYRVTSLSNYGNYLAIAVIPSVNGIDGSGAGGKQAGVYLWDMTSTTWNEFIPWGIGKLQVINNLGGYLIGISDTEGSSSAILDFDSITIKTYSGGTPQTVKEIATIKQTSTAPDAIINPRVNFIYKNRLYFSVNIQGGSTSPSYIGLWSIGKSKESNSYAVTLERVATTGNTETAVLAAGIIGDEVAMCYNAEGTLSFTNTAASSGDQWTATSIYESLVNPGMTGLDRATNKKLVTVAAYFMPLTSTGTVVMRCRVDGGVGGAWIPLFSKTSTTPDTGLTMYECPIVTTMGLDDGVNYEFRLESTGGAVILGFAYKYMNTISNIV